VSTNDSFMMGNFSLLQKYSG